MKTQIEATIEEGIKALQAQQYGKAESLLRQALQNARYTGNELLTAACLDSLGEVSFQQSQFEQAQPYFEEALAIRRKNLPAGHEDTVTSLNNLAAVYFFQGKYKPAKPICEQLIAIYEGMLGKDHPEVATCLINLGLIAMAEGKLGNAEQRFAEATNIRQAFYEPMHILVGNSLSHLGNAYFEQQLYDKASEKFKEALAVLEKHHDSDNSDLQAVTNKLIYALEQAGKFEELEQIYLKLINSTEFKLGPASPEAAKHLEKLANIHLKARKYAEAEKIFQRLLSMKRHAYGDIHPEVAAQLTNLAFIRQATNNSSQAENLFLQALNIYEKYKYKASTGLVPIFPKYLEAIKNLATFYNIDKRFAKAEQQWQQLIPLIEPVSSNNPQLLLDAYEYLAICQKEQNKLSDAYPSLQRALTFLDKNANNTKIDKTDYKLRQARLITNLANILKTETKYAEAEAQYKKALEILMKSLGPDHPDLAPALEGYADLLMLTYREQEAEHMLSCARALTKKA